MGNRLVGSAAAVAALAAGHATYLGYSGRTTDVRGLPRSYTPGQVCTISVIHASGTPVNNLSASERQGTGSTKPGTIAAGHRAAAYSTGGEASGARRSGDNRDPCTS
jgi:hypothetical protein